MPFFSVIVPTWNRAPYLRQCLARLRNQETTRDYEVILLDNGSVDQTVETFRREAELPGGHRFRYFALREPGSSAARNRGARVARGEWLAFTDDDCLPPPGWLEAANRIIRENGRTGPFAGPAVAVPGRGSANWFPPELEDLKEPAECNFFIPKEIFFQRGGFPEDGGPKGGQWRTHEGNRLFQDLDKQGKRRTPTPMQPEILLLHHLEGRRCHLKFRLYKKFLGGWAQGRESVHKRRGASLLRLFWNLLLLPGLAFSGWIRNRTVWPEWSLFLCEKGSVKVYRIGELAGQTLGDSWGFLKKMRRLRRSDLAQLLCQPLGRPEAKVLAPDRIPHDARIIRESGWIPQARTEVIFGRPHPWLSHQYLHFPAQWCLRDHHVRVYGPTLGVVTRKEGLISSVSIEWGRSPDDHFTRRRLFLPRPRKIQGRTLILASTGGNTFFHWMLDVLPRWEIARQAGWDPSQYDHVLVNSRRISFQQDSLTGLDVSPDRILCLDDHPALELSEALLPSLPGISGVPRDSSVRFLRQLFLKDEPPTRGGRRLFISRENSRHRHLKDSGALWQELQTLGFEKFEDVEKSVEEQAQVFQSASLIVAVHGAALTNLVFCQPGTTLLELFSPAYVNPCYRDLCHVAGLRHLAAVVGAGPTVEWSHAYPSGDLVPSPGEIRGILDWVRQEISRAGSFPPQPR